MVAVQANTHTVVLPVMLLRAWGSSWPRLTRHGAACSVTSSAPLAQTNGARPSRVPG